MITPKFEVDQTDNQIIITIEVPYTNVKDTEIHVNGTDVGTAWRNDNSSAKFFEETKSFVITLDKVCQGETFEGLQMLTKLLQPHESNKVVATKPLIEVLADETEMDSEDLHEHDFEEEDWFCEQTLPSSSAVAELMNKNFYGFANGHKGLQDKFEAELGEVSLIKNPDSLPPSERTKIRLDAEKEKFSDEHYLSDFLENKDVQEIIRKQINLSKFSQMTDTDKDRLKNFKNREFLLDVVWQKRLYLGLYDIMYSYIYDLKITRGSHCVETPWNISRISSTLSWFEVFDTVDEVLKSCIRRSLVYPYYRNWDLSTSCAVETLNLFKKGTSYVLKCLLNIYSIFAKREPYYLLNQLYIEEYCIWVQKRRDTDFETLVSAMSKAIESLSKQKVDLDLVELEAAGFSVEDEEMEDAISSRIHNVSI